jgi:hypothetical protein
LVLTGAQTPDYLLALLLCCEVALVGNETPVLEKLKERGPQASLVLPATRAQFKYRKGKQAIAPGADGEHTFGCLAHGVLEVLEHHRHDELHDNVVCQHNEAREEKTGRHTRRTGRLARDVFGASTAL